LISLLFRSLLLPSDLLELISACLCVTPKENDDEKMKKEEESKEVRVFREKKGKKETHMLNSKKS
jgi:hypothetical protein